MLLESERGGPILEFAIILPIIVTLLFGVIQYALIFGAYITVRNASAVAARYAILSTPTPTDGQVQGVAAGALIGLDPAGLATPVVTDETVNGVAGARGVSLTYSYRTMFPVPGVSNGAFTLTAKTIMR